MDAFCSPMNRRNLIESIVYYFSHLRLSVENLNSLNLQDINVHAENFFRDFLNIALGYELENINITEQNAKSIDLGDKKNRIAIQVTSTANIAKVRHTHKGFVNRALYEQYDRLVVLIIGEKRSYREAILGGNGVFELSLDDDVWDIPKLLSRMNDLPSDKLERCRDFLRDELTISMPRHSTEVDTLIRLVEVLSNAEEALSVGDNREDPDPERKMARFADHAKFLERQYVDLHEIYGRTLAEVDKYTDLSHMRVRKLQLYLMTWSDRVLNECGGNPKDALEVLCNKTSRMIETSDVIFDNGAIRYYLIYQLIACNVFPNKNSMHA